MIVSTGPPRRSRLQRSGCPSAGKADAAAGRVHDDELKATLVFHASNPPHPDALVPGTGSWPMIALFRTYLRPYVVPLALVLILLLIQAIGNLYLPDLNADIINNGVAKGDNDYILRTGGLMLVVTALLAVAAVIGVYWGARVAMGFGRDVRSAIFSKVETFSQVEVNRFGPASLITRNTNDVQQVQTVVFLGLTIMISAPILIVGGIIMALRTDVPCRPARRRAAIDGRRHPLVLTRAVPLFAGGARRSTDQPGHARDPVGRPGHRAFVRTPHEEEAVRRGQPRPVRHLLGVTRLFAITIPTMTAIFNLSTVAVIWFGATRVNDGQLSIGNLTAFMQYLAQILFAVLTAVFMFILIPRGAVSAGRIREVLDTEPMIREPESPISPDDPAKRGEVIFDGVEFRYPGAEQPVLREIAFRAGPGETTAIVGSTAAASRR